MAKKIIQQLVSDLSGQELTEDGGETVSFSLDGTSYEVDLSTKEADKFRGLFQDYIAVGRRSNSPSGKSRRGGSRSGTSRSKEQLAEMRIWLRENGHDVSDRGRISQELQELFDNR